MARLVRCPAWPAHVVSSAGPGTAGADSGLCSRWRYKASEVTRGVGKRLASIPVRMGPFHHSGKRPLNGRSSLLRLCVGALPSRSRKKRATLILNPFGAKIGALGTSSHGRPDHSCFWPVLGCASKEKVKTSTGYSALPYTRRPELHFREWPTITADG